MATATARAPQPGKQKGRPVAGRPLAIHVSSNEELDSIRERQAQFLVARFAMPVSIASTIAALAWGVRHG